MTARFNIFTPEFWADPYPILADMRRQPTLAQVEPIGFWGVTRYADALEVFKNPQLFTSTGQAALAEPAWLGQRNPFAHSVVMLDPPRHTRLRALVNRAFGQAALNRLEPRIRAYAEQAAAELPLGRPVDFIESFALRVPAAVIGELLGLDASLHPRFKRWADDIVLTTSVPPDAHELQARVRATYQEMQQYLGEVLEDRRRSPREDMVSDLLAARVDGEALSGEEMLGFLFLLLVAGLETTVHLLAHSALVLTERPDVLARVRADRSLIPRFVEEVLRFAAPAQTAVRSTTADTVLSGTRLPAGSHLLLFLGAISRDEAQFPNGERFDLEREGQANMPFGHGIHFCLGAPLARLEARVALEALFDRCGGMEREAGPVQWNQSITVRGPKVLPLTLRPA